MYIYIWSIDNRLDIYYKNVFFSFLYIFNCFPIFNYVVLHQKLYTNIYKKMVLKPFSLRNA